MDSKERTKRHFDSTAADYDHSDDGIFCAEMYAPLIAEIHRSNPNKLLDIGCGNGNVLVQLVRDGYSLTGVDLSEVMIGEAKRRLDGCAELVVADAGKLPFLDSTFDTLICNASFHHYTDPEGVIKEMYRVLKPDAVLLIGECYMPQPFRAFMNLFIRFSPDGDYHFYGKWEMFRLLHRYNFHVQRIRDIGRNKVLYIAKAEKRDEEHEIA